MLYAKQLGRCRHLLLPQSIPVAVEVYSCRFRSKKSIFARNDDGVHWAPAGYRHMNTLITFFLADAMMEPLPPTVFEYLTSLDIDDPHDANFHVELISQILKKQGTLDGDRARAPDGVALLLDLLHARRHVRLRDN